MSEKVTYKCWRCGSEFTVEEGLETFMAKESSEGYTFLRCPYCGYRIIGKTRRPGLKYVKAI